MDYTEKLAAKVIAEHGLGRTTKYRWKKEGEIPDFYFKAGYKKTESLTKKQREQQELILKIINDPLIKHTAFDKDTAFPGKLDEMYTLRRGQNDTSRSRQGRPNIPNLNFSSTELRKIIIHLQKLATQLSEQLSLANGQPYERRQDTLKELLRSQKELTVRQTVSDIEPQAANRWVNFVKNVRSPLPDTDRYIIAHVFSKLQDLLALINSAINPTK